MKCTLSMLASGACLLLASSAMAATNVSAADRNFVATVSQGGMFEVQAGELAAIQGSTQDVRDQGNTEAHDHNLVGDTLKSTASAAGISFSDRPNAMFQKMLADLKALSGPAFDQTYLRDMDIIHAMDGAAFAAEASSGTNPGLRAFAVETHRIVIRHIGELSAKP